jgi:hypothetical protein
MLSERRKCKTAFSARNRNSCCPATRFSVPARSAPPVTRRHAWPRGRCGWSGAGGASWFTPTRSRPNWIRAYYDGWANPITCRGKLGIRYSPVRSSGSCGGFGGIEWRRVWTWGVSGGFVQLKGGRRGELRCPGRTVRAGVDYASPRIPVGRRILAMDFGGAASMGHLWAVLYTWRTPRFLKRVARILSGRRCFCGPEILVWRRRLLGPLVRYVYVKPELLHRATCSAWSSSGSGGGATFEHFNPIVYGRIGGGGDGPDFDYSTREIVRRTDGWKQDRSGRGSWLYGGGIGVGALALRQPPVCPPSSLGGWG